MLKTVTQQIGVRAPRGLAYLRRSPSIGVTILRGSGSALLVNGLGVATAFCAHFVLARAMGAAEYGIFAVTMSIVSVCVLVPKLGLDLTLVRFVAQYRVQHQWSHLRGIIRFAYFVTTVLGLLVSLTIATSVVVIGSRVSAGLSNTLLIATAFLPLLAVAWVSQGGLRGLKRIAQCQVPTAILRPWLLAGAVAAVCFGFGISCSAAITMSVNVLAMLVAVVLGAVWLQRAMPVESRQAVPLYETRNWLRTSVPMFLITAMRVLITQIDIILVGLILGPMPAGVYGVASRAARLVTFGMLAGNAIAGPVISELHFQDRRHDLQRATVMACWIATSVALLIAVLLFAARSPLLGLFGPEFRTGAVVLVILGAGQVVNACTGPVGTLLNMTGHQSANARILAVITVLNLTCTYPAILYWGIEGAAVVTSALIALKNIWTWVVVRQHLGINSSVLPLPLPARHVNRDEVRG